MEKTISRQQQEKDGIRRDHNISLITVSGIEIRLDCYQPIDYEKMK